MGKGSARSSIDSAYRLGIISAFSYSTMSDNSADMVIELESMGYYVKRVPTIFTVSGSTFTMDTLLVIDEVEREPHLLDILKCVAQKYGQDRFGYVFRVETEVLGGVDTLTDGRMAILSKDNSPNGYICKRVYSYVDIPTWIQHLVDWCWNSSRNPTESPQEQLEYQLGSHTDLVPSQIGARELLIKQIPFIGVAGEYDPTGAVIEHSTLEGIKGNINLYPNKETDRLPWQPIEVDEVYVSSNDITAEQNEYFKKQYEYEYSVGEFSPTKEQEKFMTKNVGGKFTNPNREVGINQGGIVSRTRKAFEEDMLAIISAYRGEYTEQENEKRNAKLCLELRKDYFGYRTNKGAWKDPDGELSYEKSLLVNTRGDISYDDFRKVIHGLAVAFEQYAYIIKKGKGEPAYLIVTETGEEQVLGSSLSVDKLTDTLIQYKAQHSGGLGYTVLGYRKGKKELTPKDAKTKNVKGQRMEIVYQGYGADDENTSVGLLRGSRQQIYANRKITMGCKDHYNHSFEDGASQRAWEEGVAAEKCGEPISDFYRRKRASFYEQEYDRLQSKNQAGYDGYSMSNNARDAYDSGEMPLSKWTKSEIMDGIEQILKDNNLLKYKAELQKLPLTTLKDKFLIRTSWHHTSKTYNKTDFYSIDEDEVENLNDNVMAELAKGVADAKAKKKEPIPEKPIEYVKCAYEVWEGTGRRGKYIKYTAYGIREGSWIRLKDGTKKDTSGRHFFRAVAVTKDEYDKASNYPSTM